MRGIHLAPLRCAIWRRHEPLITLLAARTARQPCTTMWEMRGNGNGSRSGRRRVEKRFLHIAPVLMPPIIFGGLFVALWCWKCMMMVLCQNYIIYNPFLPPNARGMRIDEYVRECGGIGWREERIRSLDGTELALCVAEVTPPRNIAKNQRVYILYFQGNASSLPPRLPDLSWVLRRLQDMDNGVHYTMVCLSYRGYWTSHDRPSEKGIDMDSQAALNWLSRLHETRADKDSSVGKPVVVLWGQSIGCGFATNLAARGDCPSNLQINSLVLETPFMSTRTMLQALYPQKWLPYQYLHPFLWNHLDSWTNLGTIAGNSKDDLPGIYLVEAAKDELVPAEHAVGLNQRCQDVGLPVEWRKVRGALHNEAVVRVEGKKAIAQSIASAVARAQTSNSRVDSGVTISGEDNS